MMSPRPLIALISATPLSLPPVLGALADDFPAARPWNLLDDRLQTEAEERGGVTPQLRERMRRLIGHAVTEGADGILLTCSMYSGVARDLAGDSPVPLFGPDDAAFRAVLDDGHPRIGVVANSELAAQDSAQRLAEVPGAEGREIIPIFVAGVLAASRAGDAEEVARLVATAVRALPSPVDAILLAQYSLSPATASTSDLSGLPVYSGPVRAVAALRAALEAQP